MYGVNGFWVKISFTVALNSSVRVSSVTYGSGFTSIQNVWDGYLVDALEAQLYKASAAAYYIYGTTSITLNGMKTTDYLYFNSPGPIVAAFIEAGGTPNIASEVMTLDVSPATAWAVGATITGAISRNTCEIISYTTATTYLVKNRTGTFMLGEILSDGVNTADQGAANPTFATSTAATAVNSFQYLNPAGTWTSVGTFTDGTVGLSKTGYITFARQSDICPMQFNGLPYFSYWYRFTVDTTLSDSINIGIQVIPYYDISSFGVGLCNTTWKDKAVYVFDQDPSYMYISVPGSAQVLSSTNSALFQAGDGRANRICCMKPFYTELLIAQEEKGATGGCITLVQGTKPEDLGRILISNFYGTMNSQSMEVVETVESVRVAGGETVVGHNAFILSRRGILVTEGKSINFIPGFEQVRNYFDPSSSTCIHTGYENNMYLRYDSSYHVLKIGLTTGTATENNVFLVYDLLTKSFSTDSYAYPLSCECECDAASGDIPIIQLGGGQGDGTVYILNSGLNDVSIAVDSFVTQEFNSQGEILRDEEMIIRVKAQTGNMTVTPYYNGVIQSPLAKTLSLTAEKTGERIRRHRFPLNYKDQNISIKLRHNTVNESFYLLDYGIKLEEYSEQ